MAAQIEETLDAFLNQERCNSLPEELSILENLAAVLRKVSRVVGTASTDDSRVSDLELAIQEMAAEILALKEQLAALTSRPPDSPFLKSFKEQSGKSLGDWKMWGALISGSYLLLGEPAIGATLTQITESLKALIGKPPT